MSNSRLCWMAGALIGLAVPLPALTPTAQELARPRAWLAPWLGQTQTVTQPHLQLQHEDVADHIARTRSWRGTPFQIGDKTYPHGLAFNANKRFRIALGQPAQRFLAEVGLENNDDTRRGNKGSVTFHVLLNGQEVVSTPVLRLQDGPLPLDVPLQGASEFEIRVGDAGDGRGWDQALWGGAVIVLQDGRQLRLEDLPLEGAFPQILSPTQPPFSFQYDGQPVHEKLAHWNPAWTSRPLDHDRTQHTWTCRDPATGLEARCVLVEYRDFPTVEWTLHFKNTGADPTPILSDIQALNLALARFDNAEFLLHHHVGSPADGNDYAPRQTALPPQASLRLGGEGGRPTNKDWSYFNLEQGKQGLIVAVGWPGQWSATFTRDPGRLLTLRAGQELTRFTLLPGEEVRSPLIVLQFWEGDWIRAQNLWRRWMMAHSMPKPGGQLPPPQLLASSSRQYDEMINANETNQILFINRFLEEKIPLDYWWMDAGWYIHHGGGWPRVGTWLVDSNRFPRGLRAVTDHAHAQGLQTLLWFEPERVTPGTWLAENHPDWILGGAAGGLLNLGHTQARQWLIDHVDRTLTEQGIDLYRQDFNINPLDLWRRADEPDRQGLTEIQHVTGYLAFWDALRQRHPGLLIDSCASGGRRNDLESMRRAVPLWRSDYAFEATGHQGMMYGLSLWLPFHGTGTVGSRHAPYYGSGPTPVEPYAFWSNAGQSLTFGIDIREPNLDYDTLRRLIRQWQQINPFYYGDFYPLTPWSRDDTAWMAWQFNRPEQGDGMIQAFRRPHSFYESARFPLHNLEPDATYLLTNLDTSQTQRLTGQTLLNPGLSVSIPSQPGCALYTYTKRSP